MADLFWLPQAQIGRTTPHFHFHLGWRGVDDQRVVSGIPHLIRNGLRWRDAPAGYGPHQTLDSRFIRWSRPGVFNRICADLAGQAGGPDRLMIDARHLKAHRTAASLLEKRLFRTVTGAPRAA